ncbi:pseudouridine synthase [Falsarthrobacter nasiphocae]|uniref:Pseudouridine synthase n=1 Tax=Falsarthrobacter nasiphocae TaxID=189863 RepID=A0AAE3YGI5_9MICC|nr:pseudouridine synthase [Falsarthrobacter nasiphocae]MDR6891376.1 23S rRNA pseudouridine2605 synthase/16S rRNA pseudouridine516 synthase [Falsarthrobacter nasiphocae]
MSSSSFNRTPASGGSRSNGSPSRRTGGPAGRSGAAPRGGASGGSTFGGAKGGGGKGFGAKTGGGKTGGAKTGGPRGFGPKSGAAGKPGKGGPGAKGGQFRQAPSSAGKAFAKDRRGRELKPLRPEDRAPIEPRAARGDASSEQEGVRLQKVLANAGVASRRACEQMIDEGRVEVNGEVIIEQGRRVDPERDVIHVDGERIQLDASKTYIVFNKPKGVVSTMTDPEGRPAVSDFVKGKQERLFHVGRLDAETEGLLILTNDGELANRLMHPRYNISKTYLVQVRGPLAPGIGKQMRDGLKLEDGWASVDSFRLIDSRPGHVLVEVVLHNGKNRIVRRLFDAVGHPVERLLRVAVGPISLGDQKQGTVRTLGRHEVGHLLSLVGL